MAFVPAAAVSIMSWRHRAPAGTAPRAGIPSGEWRIDRRLGAPLIVLSLMFLAVPAFGFLGYGRAWPPDPRLDTNHFPVAAANFLEKEPVGSRIFNAYDYGGYLIDRLAPKRKVFIDGRYFVYGEAIYRDYLEIRDGGGNARALLDRYRADLLLVRYPEPDGYQGLAAEVRAWTGWSLVFWDDISLLYVKDSAATREWLSKHAYGWLDPTLPPAMEDVAYWRIHFQNLLSEAGRAQAEAPNAVRPLLVEALACEYNGLDGDAASAYEAILKRHPGNRPANDGLKRIRSRHPGGIPAPTMKGER
jgi:hypothetical protein